MSKKVERFKLLQTMAKNVNLFKALQNVVNTCQAPSNAPKYDKQTNPSTSRIKLYTRYSKISKFTPKFHLT